MKPPSSLKGALPEGPRNLPVYFKGHSAPCVMDLHGLLQAFRCKEEAARAEVEAFGSSPFRFKGPVVELHEEWLVHCIPVLHRQLVGKKN